MSSVIVMAAYKPKPGQADALRALMRDHHLILLGEQLVTDRKPILMEAKDGTVVEVFEWKSAGAIEQAHSNPVVLAMWERYAKACDYIPVGQLEEAGTLFSSFAPFS